MATHSAMIHCIALVHRDGWFVGIRQLIQVEINTGESKQANSILFLRRSCMPSSSFSAIYVSLFTNGRSAGGDQQEVEGYSRNGQQTLTTY